MTLSKVTFEGRQSNFYGSNPNDHIQGFHCRGVFYEQKQLEAHRELIPMGSTVLDVGANVGNHTLFYAMHTWGAIVYPFEPNKVARFLLEGSINGNSDYRAGINTSYIHYAIGKEAGKLDVKPDTLNNLGGTQMVPTSSGGEESVDCVRLDDLSFDGNIAFIKIDVEGMELDVLRGASAMIARHRPVIALEVSHLQDRLFWAWAQANGYEVIRAFFEYIGYKNYIIIPKS